MLAVPEGDHTQLDALLARLERPLDAANINVLGGDAEAHPLTDRVRVARLSGMPTASTLSPQQQAAYAQTPWARDFVDGTIGFVGAVETGAGGAAPTPNQFSRAWEEAGAGKRVFLAFTQADVAHAHAVAKALQAEGYVTFVYLQPEDVQPRFTEAEVARYFREADAHYVVDSPAARRSPGVWLEARVHRFLSRGRAYVAPDRDTFWRGDDDPTTGGKPPRRPGPSRGPGPAPDAAPTTRAPDRGPRGPGGSGGASGAAHPGTYAAPRGSAKALRESPQVLKEAGGIMFDAQAEARDEAPALDDLYLSYDATAAPGARWSLREKRWYTIAGYIDGPIAASLEDTDDELVATMLRFVQDDRPVLVNIQRVEETTCRDRRARALGAVELHPALVGTRVGRDIALADTLAFEVVRQAAFEANQDPEQPASQRILAELRAMTAAKATVSNVNDVDQPPVACVRGEQLVFEGAPTIEFLYAGRRPDEDPPERAELLSSVLTSAQAELLGEQPAYQTMLRVWRIQGLLRFYAARDPATIARLIGQAPAPAREATTRPTWDCDDCTPELLEELMAACPGLRG